MSSLGQYIRSLVRIKRSNNDPDLVGNRDSVLDQLGNLIGWREERETQYHIEKYGKKKIFECFSEIICVLFNTFSQVFLGLTTYPLLS